MNKNELILQLEKVELELKNKLYNFILVDELKSSKNKCYVYSRRFYTYGL